MERGMGGWAGRQGERVRVFLQQSFRSVFEVRAGMTRQGLRAVSSGADEQQLTFTSASWQFKVHILHRWDFSTHIFNTQILPAASRRAFSPNQLRAAAAAAVG